MIEVSYMREVKSSKLQASVKDVLPDKVEEINTYIVTALELRPPAGCAETLSIFFFSSRRRHTRLQGDWSSDVCSSDLCCPSTVSVVPAARASCPPASSRLLAPTRSAWSLPTLTAWSCSTSVLSLFWMVLLRLWPTTRPSSLPICALRLRPTVRLQSIPTRSLRRAPTLLISTAPTLRL